MPVFRQLDVGERPYLYAEGTSSMDPSDISKAMGTCFSQVMGFMQRKGVAPAGHPLAVYYTYSPDSMAFRAGVEVAAADLPSAEGEVKADVTPAGPVLSFTHVGPYSKLRESYAEMMHHVEVEGLTMGAPAWEVYVDDPGEIPEEKLRTEVFVRLG